MQNHASQQPAAIFLQSQPTLTIVRPNGGAMLVAITTKGELNGN